MRIVSILRSKHSPTVTFQTLTQVQRSHQIQFHHESMSFGHGGSPELSSQGSV